MNNTLNQIQKKAYDETCSLEEKTALENRVWLYEPEIIYQ